MGIERGIHYLNRISEPTDKKSKSRYSSQVEKCAFSKKIGFFVLISVSLGGVLLSLILCELILSVINKPSNHIWGWRHHGNRTKN